MAEESKEKRIFHASNGDDYDLDAVLKDYDLNKAGYTQWAIYLDTNSPFKKKKDQSSVTKEELEKAYNDVIAAASGNLISSWDGDSTFSIDPFSDREIDWNDTAHRHALRLYGKVLRKNNPIAKPETVAWRSNNIGTLDFNNIIPSYSEYSWYGTDSEQSRGEFAKVVDAAIKAQDSTDKVTSYDCSPYADKDAYKQSLNNFKTALLLENTDLESLKDLWLRLGGNKAVFENWFEKGISRDTDNIETKIQLLLLEYDAKGLDPTLRDTYEKSLRSNLNAKGMGLDLEQYNALVNLAQEQRKNQAYTALMENWKDSYSKPMLVTTGFLVGKYNTPNAAENYLNKLLVDLNAKKEFKIFWDDLKSYLMGNKSNVDGLELIRREGTFNGNKYNIGSYYATLLNRMLNDPNVASQNFIPINEDEFIIKETVDRKTGSAVKYNRKIGTYTKYHVSSDSPALEGYLKSLWSKDYDKQVRLSKNGGKLEKINMLRNGSIIKALSGLNASLDKMSSNINLQNNITAQNKLKLLKDLAEQSGKTQELYKHDTKKRDAVLDLSDTDYLRLSAGATDLASAIASFWPGYGTLASLGTGIIATGQRAAADAIEGASSWDITKNVGKELGMTAVGLIPYFGSLKKANKAWKAIRGFAPLALSGLAAADAKAGWDAYKRIDSGKGTVNDYKIMLLALTSLANATRSVNSLRKANTVRNVSTLNNLKYSVKTKNGYKELTKELFEQLQNTLSRNDMNLKFKSFEGMSNEDLDFTHPILGKSLLSQNKKFWNKGVPYKDNSIEITPEAQSNNWKIESWFTRPWVKMPNFSISTGYTYKKQGGKLESLKMLRQGGEINFTLPAKFQAGGDLREYDLLLKTTKWDPTKRYHFIYNDNPSEDDLVLILRNPNGTDNVAVTTDENSTGNNYYDIEKGYQEAEKSYYNNARNALTTDRKLAEAWAKYYKDNVQDKSDIHAGWFKLDGTFDFDNFKNTAPRLWKDHKNGIGHDIFRGKTYFIRDTSGIKHYYDGDDTEFMSHYTVSDKPDSNPVFNYIDEYELIAKPTDAQGDGLPKPDQQGEGKPQGRSQTVDTSQIKPNPNETEPLSHWMQPYKYNEYLADALDLSGLMHSLWTNNRIAQIAKTKVPVLKSPYLGHRNIYGDFAALLNYKNQGAKVMSKAADIANSTANAELGVALRLESQGKANQLEQQGFLIDNAKIMQDIKDLQSLRERIYQLNHDTADENMARLTAKINADKDIEQGRLNANFTSLNNYRMGLVSNLRHRYTDQQLRAGKLYLLRMLQWAKEQLNNDPEYLKLLKAYENDSSDANLTALTNYQIKRLKQLEPYINLQYMNLYAGRYNNDDDFKFIMPEYLVITGNKPKSERRGGRIVVDSSRMKYRADDLRELRKLIRTNIRASLHALDNVSRATLLELKKMMGI